MKNTREYVRAHEKQAMDQLVRDKIMATAQFHDEFVDRHIPRFHRFVMTILPIMAKWFDYTLEPIPGSRNDRDVILKRRGVEVARNFER